MVLIEWNTSWFLPNGPGTIIRKDEGWSRRSPSLLEVSLYSAAAFRTLACAYSKALGGGNGVSFRTAKIFVSVCQHRPDMNRINQGGTGLQARPWGKIKHLRAGQPLTDPIRVKIETWVWAPLKWATVCLSLWGKRIPRLHLRLCTDYWEYESLPIVWPIYTQTSQETKRKQLVSEIPCRIISFRNQGGFRPYMTSY